MKTKLSKLLLLSTLAAQAFEYQATIEGLQTTGTEVELVKVPVEQSVFSKIRSDFKDLVILTKDQKSLPFTLMQDTIKTKKAYFTYQRINVGQVNIEKNSVSVDINLKTPQLLSALKIKTPLKNFEFVVTLKSLVGNIIAEQTIYDYSRFTESRQEVVTFTPQLLQHFTVTIKGLTQLQTKTLFEWREVSGERDTQVEKTSKVSLKNPRFSFWVGTKKYRQQSTQLFKAVEKGLVAWEVVAEGPQTIVTINTNGLPLSAIKLDIDEKNFKRNFTLKYEDQRHGLIKYGKLERWTYRKFNKSVTTILLPKLSSNRLVLTINNNQNSPLTIANISFEMPQYALFFLMDSSTDYLIHFGDFSFKHAATPLPPKIIAESTKSLVGRMGPIEKNQVNVGSMHSNKFGFLVPLILLAIMTFLAWGIFDTLKKVDSKS